MKKRQTGIFICVVCAAIVCGGCSMRREKLTVGVELGFPPYTYEDEEGKPVGFDVEMAQALCDLKGWEIEFQEIGWDEKEIALNSEQIDCIWSGFTITGREEEYEVSVPYSTGCYTVIVPADSDIRELSDLENKVVGVQVATSVLEYMMEDEEGKKLCESFGLLTQFSDYRNVIDVLEKSSMDAVIADIGTAEFYVRYQGDKVRLLDATFREEKYGVAVKKGNTMLCKEINDGLQTLAENGTVAGLAEKYELSHRICVE